MGQPILGRRQRRSAREGVRRLHESDGADKDCPDDALLHEQVAVRAARAPDRVAARYGDDSLTYGQLDRLASAVELRLRAAGACPGSVVGIAVDRSLAMIAGMLGILKSGAAYLPVDPTHPAERIAFMIAESGVRVVVTESAVSKCLPARGLAVVNIDDLSPDVRAYPAVPATSAPGDTAYVMYTSGSTGRPKGVRVLHRNLSNLVRALRVTPGLKPDDVVIAVVPYIFDVSVADLLAPLACGAQVVVASREDGRDPARLGALIERFGGTLMHATPPTWRMLVESGWEGDEHLAAVSAGDVLSATLAADLLARCGAVWNGYGPTEATVYATFSRVTRGEPPSIGQPLANVRAYVLDRMLESVPVGATGELFVAGAGVADGYLGRPDETAARFIPDPFFPGEIMYRTGDRARLLPNSDFEYLGRLDRQVKVRGVRVEPDEIEAVLRSHCDVADAVVVAQDDNQGDLRLVVYYVPKAWTPSPAALRRRLAAALPAPMVPSRFVPMQSLPLNSSGKLDRAALPLSDDSYVAHAQLNTPPSTELETKLAALWARTLSVKDVRMTDDFFDSGGDSITAARFVAAVERQLRMTLPLSVFIEDSTTLADIVESLHRENNRSSDAARVLASEPQVGPPLFFVHPHESAMFAVRHFARALADDHRVITIALKGARFDQSIGIEDLAASVVRSIRETQVSPPYYLTGYSIGGLVAYEAAGQLQALGHQIAWLGLLDSRTPDFSRATEAWMLSTRRRVIRLARGGLSRALRRAASPGRGEPAARTVRREVSRPGDDFDWRGALHLITRYKCSVVDAPLDLFVSADEIARTDSRSLGWESVHPGTLRVHEVPGDHETMMVEPNVSVLVETVCRSIDQADRRRSAALTSST